MERCTVELMTEMWGSFQVCIWVSTYKKVFKQDEARNTEFP